MALPLIPILLLGGAVMVMAGGAKKGGGGGGYLFDGQCRGIPLQANNVQQLAALARRLSKIGTRLWRDTFGIDLTSEQLLSTDREPIRAAIRSILGDAPGNQITNIDFCSAFATGLIQAAANPACMARLEEAGLTQSDGDNNVLGKPDWMMVPPGGDYPGPEPGLYPDFPDIADSLQDAFNQSMSDVAAIGYDVGVAFAQAGPPKSFAVAWAERIAG